MFESRLIAQCLCELWAPFLRGGYSEYLSAHLGRPLKNKVAIASFYIDEMSYGDVDQVGFGSILKNAWTADADGLHVRTQVHDFTEVNGFFKVPSIKFLADKEVLAVGETFGLNLFARKKYRMVQQDGKVGLVDEQIVRIAMSKGFMTE